ncbi:predicted protein [Streptomyces sp. SPB78]|nr:predicted protein [Streptomyces sp. SPB78]
MRTTAAHADHSFPRSSRGPHPGGAAVCGPVGEAVSDSTGRD